MEKQNSNYIFQAWLVLLLAICFGASLSGIQIYLAPIIETNKINEIRQKVPELVLGAENAQTMLSSGNILDITPQMVSVEKDKRTISYSVYQAGNYDNLSGWVVKSTGQGYADKIELLIGFDPLMKTITGLFVLDQKETPGLGNKIIDSAFRGQFISKSLDQLLRVTKTGATAPNEIDSITGATISTRSVCAIINQAASDLKAPLAERVRAATQNIE
jgi:electron transport complex protein RnfG